MGDSGEAVGQGEPADWGTRPKDPDADLLDKGVACRGLKSGGECGLLPPGGGAVCPLKSPPSIPQDHCIGLGEGRVLKWHWDGQCCALCMVGLSAIGVRPPPLSGWGREGWQCCPFPSTYLRKAFTRICPSLSLRRTKAMI